MIVAAPFRLCNVNYAKNDSITNQLDAKTINHLKHRGYLFNGPLLQVIRPFTCNGSNYLTGNLAPAGLTDNETRRLIMGRYLS